MKKKLAAFVMAAVMGIFCMTGCGDTQMSAPSSSKTESNETDTQTNETTTQEVNEREDAAILVVSFGTSYNDSRDITIGAVEDAISKAFPEYEIRRAFTSQIIIDILKEREKLEIDNVEQALDRAVKDGIQTLIVQPTHLMNGYEYTDLSDELKKYEDKFEQVVIGEPLLTSDEDFEAVAKAITEKTKSYDDGKTAICFMGHGTEAESNSVYTKLQEQLTKDGKENYYIGTVEAEPSLGTIVKALKNKGTYKRVVLEPLMLVAGDHANNDMAGEEDDTWKSVFEKEGYEVECIIEGLGQIPAIQDIYVEHVKAADNVVKENTAMTPVYGKDIKNGSYAVKVKSSSSMFRIIKAELEVADGSMNAVITLSGKGYLKLFMGTGEEALKAGEESYIPYEEDSEGAYTYRVPVEALDQEIDCAAYSKKKHQWYDRKLVFQSSSLPKDAILAASDDQNKEEETKLGKTENADLVPVQMQVKDGAYTMEVTLAGGSKKATVSSPAVITISDKKAIASIVWSSPNYDYMIVNGTKYVPVNSEGNSVFEIPVLALDQEIPVIADTTAMSKPHEIEYTLTFHSDTLKNN